MLKSLDPNGQATWDEEYWGFGGAGPFHLDPRPLRAELDAVVPAGDRAENYPLDLKQAHYRCDVVRDASGGQGDLAGSLTATIALRDHALTATGVRLPGE